MVRNQKLLYYLFIFAMIVPNLILIFTENVPLLGKVCNIILPLSFFWFLMSLTRKPGKALWLMFWFIFLNAFQLVLLYLFGEAIIAVDMFLNLVTTNSGEVGELLGRLLPGVITVVLFYLGILSLGIISIFNKSKLDAKFIRRQRKMSGITLMFSLIFSIAVMIFSSHFAISLDVYPANVCYNAYLAIERAEQTSDFYETSEDFTYDAVATHETDEPEVYVFVIGETGRALNWGLYGYQRNTTPELEKCGDNLLVFKDVLTQSNTTHKSVPMLMSLASAENFNSVYTSKGILTAFNEAGFRTAFFSNQRHNNSFIDFYGMEATNSVFIKDLYPENANVMDMELVSFLERELKVNNHKKFIVLHSYGSHFDYFGRYPRSGAYYRPDSINELTRKHKEDLVNSYDNSIRYTDAFLKKVVDTLDSLNVCSAMVYTSDHGEDIFDDDRHLFLHASPSPSFYQLYIPYVVWLSDEYKAKYPNKCSALLANIDKPFSSNLVTIHTIMSLAGINTRYLDRSLSLADRKFTVRNRYYINDHNKPKLLKECGLKPLDEEAFKRYDLIFK